MKGFFNFVTDSMVVVLIGGLVVAAFAATYALSPLDRADVLLAHQEADTSVMGDMVSEKLSYKALWEQNGRVEFSGSQEIDDMYLLEVRMSDIEKGVSSYPVLEIENNSLDSKYLAVNAMLPTSLASDVNVGVEINSQIHYLTPAKDVYKFRIPAGESVEVGVVTDSSSQINFISEIMFQIEEIENV